MLGQVKHTDVRNVLVRGHIYLNCSLTEVCLHASTPLLPLFCFVVIGCCMSRHLFLNSSPPTHICCMPPLA
jgi:hypothetical protein